ncbi:MAG TPA: outer membrane protein assembly factor BamA [Steroidobacteraceae bacterium]
MRNGLRALCLVLSIVSAAARSQAPFHEFTVTGIRVEGLQRITEGTVFNQLPVNIGDVVTPQRLREALRALNDTGFFRDVELRREEPGVLIVVVQERPSIRDFKITGNKEVKTEDLVKSLRNVGLAGGRILVQSTLEDVRQFLLDQYFSRGRYGVVVDTRVDEVAGNLVDVHIDIDEGKRARIRRINIIGNEKFDDAELLDGLSLKASHLLSFYRGDDRYSRELLEGDLETIRSYYMDRGHADFEVTSTQVSLAPGKDDLFITINVHEGETWKLGAVKLAGRFVVPEQLLRQYLMVQPGDQYSQRLIAASEKAISDRLSESGYAFADVAAVPTPDGERHEIALTFMIEPNARAYVRHIEFSGAQKTNDEVLRRELRQMEGAVLSNQAVTRSEERLQRLPYLESVESETKRVPGSADLVDVEFKVEERPSSTLGGGIGYSERQSFLLSGSFVDSNLFGTGDRLALELNGGRYSQVYSIQHTDPYFTRDGISRSLSASYVERERLTSSFSQFTTQTYSAGFSLAYPLSEDQYLSLGLNYSHENLATVRSSSEELRDWVRSNGDYYFRRVGSDPILGTIIDSVEISGGWLWESRDRSLFPTRGGQHRLSFGITPPGSAVEYATVNFRSQQFFRIPGWDFLERFPIQVTTNLGWSTALGDTTATPPHRHIFMGGSDSVRGFRDGTLGPRDSLGNPYGGDAGFSTQFDLIVPLPEKFQTSARLSLFFDAGQSYYLGDTAFRNRRGDRTDYRFDLGEVRTSVGAAVQWLSPMGLFRLSYAVPLQYQHETRRLFGDEIERIQFSVGTAF